MTAASTAVGDDVDGRDLGALSHALDALAPLLERMFTPRASGIANLHVDGPALIVGNHSGGVLAMLEPLVFAEAVRAELGDDAMPRPLVHEILWHSPLAAWMTALGAVRASPSNAHALLDAGRSVLVYPGGDREAFRPFAERDTVTLGGRRGYVRLAIARGVPIVPVVTAGMHSGFVSLSDGHPLAERLAPASLRVGVLPVTLSFPFGLSFGVPAPYLPIDARVRIRVLPAIHFTRSGDRAAADPAYVEACHRIVLGRMQTALDDLAHDRRFERRLSLHDHLDAFLDRLDALTGATHAPHAVSPPPTAMPERVPPLRRVA